MSYSGKIIVSGSQIYGLGGSLKRKFPSADFCSRKSGFDFTVEDDRRRFAERSLSYGCYISCSSLQDFLQVQLLRDVYEAWRDGGKTGQIIAIGSAIDQEVRGQDRIYTVEKRALRDYCQNLSLLAGGGGNVIKVSYLSPGLLNTPSMLRKNPGASLIDCDYLAEVVAWLLDQPAGVLFHQVSLTPVQAP